MARAIWKILWKIPVVALAVLVGATAASQVGWSGAEMIFGSRDFMTDLLFAGGTAVGFGSLMLVKRIAKPLLWVMVPLCLYFGVVLGAWNGVASGFDYTRGEAIKYHMANAYALEHMTDKGRFLSCQDSRIELTDDAKAVCERVLRPAPENRANGSEHRCGPLGLFNCANSVSEDPTP